MAGREPTILGDDDVLLRDLGAAMRAGSAVPERFVELGRQSFAWYGIDAELAELSYDSAADLDPARFAAARGDDAPFRTLTFTSGELVLEIEVTADAVRGQLLPTGTGMVRLSVQDGAGSTAVSMPTAGSC